MKDGRIGRRRGSGEREGGGKGEEGEAEKKEVKFEEEREGGLWKVK